MTALPSPITSGEPASRLHSAPTPLQQLMCDTRSLRSRLHRIVVGLALAEETIADTLERMAAAGGPHAEKYVLHAGIARDTADDCRAFAARQADLGWLP
jgi:hypothetical protein